MLVWIASDGSGCGHGSWRLLSRTKTKTQDRMMEIEIRCSEPRQVALLTCCVCVNRCVKAHLLLIGSLVNPRLLHRLNDLS